ncbi:MAG: hypothetical protein ACTSUI_02820 [Promethearchaeota archaeon]
MISRKLLFLLCFFCVWSLFFQFSFVSGNISTTLNFSLGEGDYLIYQHNHTITTTYSTRTTEYHKYLFSVDSNTSAGIFFSLQDFTNKTNTPVVNQSDSDAWKFLGTKNYHLDQTSLSYFKFRFALPLDLTARDIITENIFRNSSLKQSYDHFFEGIDTFYYDRVYTSYSDSTNNSVELEWNLAYLVESSFGMYNDSLDVNINYQLNRANLMKYFENSYTYSKDYGYFKKLTSESDIYSLIASSVKEPTLPRKKAPGYPVLTTTFIGLVTLAVVIKQNKKIL